MPFGRFTYPDNTSVQNAADWQQQLTYSAKEQKITLTVWSSWQTEQLQLQTTRSVAIIKV